MFGLRLRLAAASVAATAQRLPLSTLVVRPSAAAASLVPCRHIRSVSRGSTRNRASRTRSSTSTTVKVNRRVHRPTLARSAVDENEEEEEEDEADEDVDDDAVSDSLAPSESPATATSMRADIDDIRARYQQKIQRRTAVVSGKAAISVPATAPTAAVQRPKPIAVDVKAELVAAANAASTNIASADDDDGGSSARAGSLPQFDSLGMRTEPHSATAPNATGPARGQLTLAATPIGNLSDMSQRLIGALRTADTIYCEDTRHSATLLAHAKCGGRPNVFSYHSHSGLGVRGHITDRLRSGEHVLYITDAGMPSISDPGHELIGLANGVGAKVDVIPGPSAVTTALALSGLYSANGEFSFLGFFPRSPIARARLLTRLSALQMVTIFFEAPHRLEMTLDFLSLYLPPHFGIVVCREMTKLHQKVYRGSASKILNELEENVKGEFVILIPPITAALQLSLGARLKKILTDGRGLTTKQAIKELSQETSMDKRKVAALIAHEEQHETAEDASENDATGAAATKK